MNNEQKARYTWAAIGAGVAVVVLVLLGIWLLWKLFPTINF